MLLNRFNRKTNKKTVLLNFGIKKLGNTIDYEMVLEKAKIEIFEL